MKVQYGIMVGTASGSQGSSVASHNRYGAYFRNRSIPVNPQTIHQVAHRNLFAQASAAWRNLTTAEADAWATWAASNPITDVLGAKQVLAGNAAFVQLNTRLLQGSASMLDLPPIGGAPDALASITLSADIGSGNFQLAYTATPLATGCKLCIDAAVVNSPSVKFVRNLYKRVSLTAAAAASPRSLDADVPDRFGGLQAGQVIYVRAYVLDTVTGLFSMPSLAAATITKTP